jgi:ribonuclease R
MRNLDDDFYYLDDESYRVVGQYSGKEFRLGDPIKIKVHSVDLQRKQMDFLPDNEDKDANQLYIPKSVRSPFPAERKADKKGGKRSEGANRSSGRGQEKKKSGNNPKNRKR